VIAADDIAARIINAAILELRDRRLRDYWTSTDPRLGMSAAQRVLHDDEHNNRLLRKANKVGGSMALAAEVWAWLLGTHPHNDRWQVPCPCTILCVVADLEDSYADDVCRVLRELEPLDVLSDACSYDDVRGYMVRGKRGLQLANGSRIIIRSGRQDGMSMEGIWAHVVVINEPPQRARWGGIMRAAALMQAPILMNFTPVGKDLSWLRYIVEEDPVTAPLWGQTVVTLSVESAPWRTQEEIDAQIANVAPWEREQRILAAWESTCAGRAYDAWDSSHISEDLPDEEVDVVLAFDHGERPGHEAVLLILRWTRDGRPHAMLLDEYVSPGATSPETDARHVEAMLQRHDIPLLAVSEGIGDVNSAGKSAAGQPLNTVFETAFASLIGQTTPPFRIRKPRKRPGSILAGTKAINFAFAESRATVHPRCEQTIRALSHWLGTTIGEDKAYTHVLDGLRYGIADWLDTSKSRENRQVGIR